MKTMIIKADDAIVERITLLFELFPKEQYELSVSPYTEEERALDEFAKSIDFNNDDQVMEFCVKMSTIGKRQWWSKHKKEYLQGVTTSEDRR
jgi:hypothetical protein